VRLDLYLTEKGYFSSRTKAKEAAARGEVIINGRTAKASQQASEGDTVEVRTAGYVSNGAYKLLAAFESFDISVSGKVCFDAGASTGGFTQVLLEKGAAKVYAADVGKELLHPAVASDPRVEARDGVNCRSLDARDFPGVSFFCADLSFISLKLVLAPLLSLLERGGEGVALLKPQFEAGRQALNRRGIVTDKAVHSRLIADMREFAGGLGAEVTGAVSAPLREQGMNHEYLLHILKK